MGPGQGPGQGLSAIFRSFGSGQVKASEADARGNEPAGHRAARAQELVQGVLHDLACVAHNATPPKAAKVKCAVTSEALTAAK